MGIFPQELDDFHVPSGVLFGVILGWLLMFVSVLLVLPFLAQEASEQVYPPVAALFYRCR
jgi:hypothetical protein